MMPRIFNKPTGPFYGFVIGITLLTMLLVFYFGWRGYDDNRNRALEGFNSRQLLLARSIAVGLETYFHEIFVSLETFSGPVHGMSGQGDRVPDLERIFRGFLPRTSVRFIDSRGILRAVYPPSDWRKDLLSRDYGWEAYFRTVRETEKPAVSAVVINEQGEDRIRFAVPVFSRDGGKGHFAGVLALSFDFQEVIQTFVNPLVAGQPIRVWLINGEGQFMAYEGGTADRCGQNARGPSREEPPLPLVGSVLAGREGTDRFHLAGTDMMAAFSPVSMGDTFWSVIVASPVAQFQGLLWKTNRQILLGSGLVLMILLLSASWTTLSTCRWSRFLEREVGRQTTELRKKRITWII